VLGKGRERGLGGCRRGLPLSKVAKFDILGGRRGGQTDHLQRVSDRRGGGQLKQV